VRLFTASYAYEGTFVAFQADSMIVEPDGWERPVRVSLGSLNRLDVRRGSRWRQGAGMGGLIGGALGGAASLLINAIITDVDVDPARAVGAGFASGLVVGATVGIVVAGDRWKQVGVHDLRVAPPVRRAGVVTLLALRF
jgi:hypothetical protein